MKRYIVLFAALLTTVALFAADEYFEPLFLSYWKLRLEEIDKNRQEPEDATVIYHYGKIFRGRTIVQYGNEVHPLTTDDKKMLEYWGQVIRWPGIEEHYKYRVKVLEGNEAYWVFMSDNTFQYVDEDELLLISYYNIGGINKTPLFQVIQIEDQLSEAERLGE